MQHLQEMCCEQCRAKVEAIERRSFEVPDLFGKEHATQAFDDRRELLMLLEAMLASLATTRLGLRQSNSLLADHMLAEARRLGLQS